MSNLKTWPEKIWLQAGDDDGEIEELPAYQESQYIGDGVTWCEDSVVKYEVQYIRADLVEEQIKEALAKERERCAKPNCAEPLYAAPQPLNLPSVEEIAKAICNSDGMDLWREFKGDANARASYISEAEAVINLLKGTK